ncbi:hypothetical protein E2C01_057555 [Portunus trituberculatus]|uniref:Uncharacterized protein n=1 Tax=Portunus trituberculatus TaxID=210409 RepID=A0A5B7H285_PORTR|nr:hypothetical protein [Portunus trituberculatus]
MSRYKWRQAAFCFLATGEIYKCKNSTQVSSLSSSSPAPRPTPRLAAAAHTPHTCLRPHCKRACYTHALTNTRAVSYQPLSSPCMSAPRLVQPNLPSSSFLPSPACRLCPTLLRLGLRPHHARSLLRLFARRGNWRKFFTQVSAAGDCRRPPAPMIGNKAQSQRPGEQNRPPHPSPPSPAPPCNHQLWQDPTISCHLRFINYDDATLPLSIPPPSRSLSPSFSSCIPLLLPSHHHYNHHHHHD